MPSAKGGRGKRLVDELRADDVEAIRAGLEAGSSYSELGRALNLSHQQISRAAETLGYGESGENAEARRKGLRIRALEVRELKREQRMADIDLLASRARRILEDPECSSQDLRNVAVVLGIAIDKRRQEEDRALTYIEGSAEERSVRTWGRAETGTPEPELSQEAPSSAIQVVP